MDGVAYLIIVLGVAYLLAAFRDLIEGDVI